MMELPGLNTSASYVAVYGGIRMTNLKHCPGCKRDEMAAVTGLHFFDGGDGPVYCWCSRDMGSFLLVRFKDLKKREE